VAVTYNGDSNTLTGQGSPNPLKLTLPMLDKVTDPAVQAALLRIQQFINNLVAPSSSGGYDSLTGAGETATPGALVQAGPFTVNAGASPGVTFNAAQSTGYGFTVDCTASAGILLEQAVGGSGCEIRMAPGGASMDLICPGAISITAWGTNEPITLTSAKLGFFGGPNGTQQTPTGSRGGNAALASLLTALAAYGLIVDGTSP